MANYSKADTVRRNQLNTYKILLDDKTPGAATKFYDAYAKYQKELAGSKFQIGKKVNSKQMADLRVLDDAILTVQNQLLKMYPLPKAVTKEVLALNNPDKPATPAKVTGTVADVPEKATGAIQAAALAPVITKADGKPAAAPEVTAEADDKPAAAKHTPPNNSFNLNLLIACAAVSTATLALGIAAILLSMQWVGMTLAATVIVGTAFSAYSFFNQSSSSKEEAIPMSAPHAIVS